MRLDERLRARGAATRRGGLVPWLPSAALLAGWLVLLGPTDSYVNPDGTAYVAVAERWLAGEAGEAVNGYWSPLLSWAMVPAMALGVPGLLSLRLVLLAASFAVLVVLRRLTLRAGAPAPTTDLVLLALAPFLVYASLFGLYPDVLSAAVLLLSADVLLRPSAPLRTTVLGGLVAGAAYLAKAFALPAVLVLVPAWVVLRRWGTGRPPPAWGRTARDAVVGLLGVALVAGAWVGVLSASYGAPTYSTAAAFNADLVAPGSAGNPFNVPGLHEPTYPGSLSAWEEPSQMRVPLQEDVRDAGEEEFVDAARPLDLVATAENAVGQARIVVGTVLRRGLPLALLAVVAVGVLARRREAPSPVVSGLLVAATVWCGGLVLIIAIERYVWFAVVCLVPAAAVGLQVLLAGRPRLARSLVAAAVVLVMAGLSLQGLWGRVGSYRDVDAAAARLASTGGLQGRVAGTQSWASTLLLCYQLDCEYLGRPESGDPGEVAAELSAADVDTLVVWGKDVLPDSTGETSDDVLAPGQLPPDEQTLQVYRVTPDALVLDRSVSTTP